MFKRLFIVFLLFVFAFLTFFFLKPIYAQASVNKYYVSNSGNDSNNGSQNSPWRTIQNCLNKVRAGDSCIVSSGTYNEILTLKTSGTASLPITLTCIVPKGCTINSGAGKTIISGARVDYYIIDGLRLVSSHVPTSPGDSTIDLGVNIPFSTTDKTVGNNNLTIRNCYVEGAVHFYGHNNLMENCELNGKDIYQNGLMDNFATSYNNVYRNNLIHNYPTRAIWSMQATDNILIEGNTIHDGLHGIDCDGAAVPTTHCKILNNNIYNVGKTAWGAAIFLENCFGCLIQGNKIHDLQNGVGIFGINYGNGSTAGASIGWHTFGSVEYRGNASGTSILNNILYNYPSSGAGINITSVNGLIIDHNTFYSVGTSRTIGFHADTDGAGLLYSPKNETITNNIFYSGDVAWYNSATSGLKSSNNLKGNPSFANPPADLHPQASSPACTYGTNGTFVGAFSCGGNPQTPTPIPTSTTTPKPGDANGDHIVNETDYSVWLNHYGQSVTGGVNGDFNNNGKVDGVDGVTWLNNYGK